MSSLEKFAKFADPDKILMVGEVGSCEFMKQTQADIYRRWLGQTPLLKHGTSTQHLVLADHLMDSSFPSVTLLEIWSAHWSVWSMRRMSRYFLWAWASTIRISGICP
jgi:hypothetical protein